MTYLELSEENDRLKEENAELRAQVERIGVAWNQMASWHAQMHDWLFHFGKHSDECLSAPVRERCICGLSAALNPDYSNQTATKAA